MLLLILQKGAMLYVKIMDGVIDKNEIWLLETAGREWVAKRIKKHLLVVIYAQASV